MSDEVKRIGPQTTVTRSCSGCAHVRSVPYREQGDSGRDVYCDHPGAPVGGHVGDTRWNTPAWCPVQTPSHAEALAAERAAGAREMRERAAAVARDLAPASNLDAAYTDPRVVVAEIADAIAALPLEPVKL